MFGSRRKNARSTESSSPVAEVAKQSTSGTDVQSPTSASATDARTHPATSPLTTAFTQIITVLMRSPLHKHLSLADLEWLVFPPLQTGQFSVGEITASGGKTSFPAAFVLWATVSTDIDRRLSENLETPIRLRPDEWRSGENLWLIEAVGDGRVIPNLLKQLADGPFKNKTVKIRSRGEQGKLSVQFLHTAIARATKAAVFSTDSTSDAVGARRS